MTIRYVSVAMVLGYHQELMDAAGQETVLVSRERLEAALARPQASAFGRDIFPTVATKAAALLDGLLQAHPFLDGNKRVALGATLSFLQINDIRTQVNEDELYQFVLDVVEHKWPEVEHIADQMTRLFSIAE